MPKLAIDPSNSPAPSDVARRIFAQHCFMNKIASLRHFFAGGRGGLESPRVQRSA